MPSEASDRITGQGDSSTSFRDTETADFTRRVQATCDDLRETGRSTDRLELPDDLCQELLVAVEKAALRSAGSINALQLAVRRFTVALRDNGAKPEDVLIAIKSVIHTNTFTLVDARQAWRSDELPQKISTWSIQEFFNEKQA